MLPWILQRAKDPVLLQMYELREKENYLPETLTEGFKQVSDVI